MRRFKLILILALLAGCSRPAKDPVEAANETATFDVIKPITLLGVADLPPNSATGFKGLSTSRQFTIKACMQDVGVQQGIGGVVWQVMDGNKLISESPPTDGSGCIVWSEKMDFSPTDSESFFYITRTIVPTSVHKGRVDLPIAINPSQKTGDVLRDLRIPDNRPARIRPYGTPASSADEIGALQIDSLSAEIVLDGGATSSAALNLNFQPKVRHTSINDQTIPEALTDGELSIRAQVVAINGSEKIPLTGMIDIPSAKIDLGNVEINQPINLLSNPPRDAILELRMEVSAVNAPSPIRNFHGRLTLSKFAGMISKGFGALKDMEENDVFLDASKAEADSEAAGGNSFGPNFIPGQIGPDRKAEIMEIDSIGYPGKLKFNMAACINNTNGETVRAETFQVSGDGVDGGSVEAVLSDKGCIIWGKTLNYDISMPQEPVALNYTFTGKSGFYKGVTVTRTVYIYPWLYASPKDAIIDMAYQGSGTNKNSAPERTAEMGSVPQIYIADARLQNNNRYFAVDAMLRLSTLRKYTATITPRIRRRTPDGKYLQSEPLPPGNYRIRLLLETYENRGEPKGRRVIDAQEVVAYPKTGAFGESIKVDVNFNFDDPTLVMGRSMFTVQVVPAETRGQKIESIPMGNTTEHFYNTFLILTPQLKPEDSGKPVGERNYRDFENEFNVAMEARRAKGFLKSFAGAEAYKNKFLLTDLPAENSSLQAAAERLAKGEKVSESEKAKSDLAVFCDQFFPSEWFEGLPFVDGFSDHGACKKNPENYVAYLATRHVREILESQEVGEPTTVDHNLNASFAVSSSESDNESNAWNVNGGVGASAGWSPPAISKGLEKIGLRIGADAKVGAGWAHTWTHNQTIRQDTNTKTNQLGRKISVDMLKMGITANVSRCVTIVRANSPEKGQKYFYCAPGVEKVSSVETYYMMYLPEQQSGIQDTSLTDQRAFLSLLRGETRLESMLKAFADTSLVFEVGPPVESNPATISDFSGPDGMIPGLLDPDISPFTPDLTPKKKK